MRIDYFFGLTSPYAYLAGRRLESLADQRGVDVAYKPIDLTALLSEREPPAAARLAYRAQDLRRRAARSGLPISEAPAHSENDPRAASVALIAAQEAGYSVGLAAHAMMRAVWADEKNIADPEVIAATLDAHGIETEALEPYRAAAEDAYAQSAAAARAVGVFGSPTYVVGEEIFWGSDRLDDLDEFLAEIR